MSIKSDSSTDYLQNQRELHGWKKWEHYDLRAIVFGAAKSGSIGEEIVIKLSHAPECSKIWQPMSDITKIGMPGILLPDWSRYNVLILSHGVTWLDWFDNIPLDKIQEIINVNLTGTVLSVQKFVQDTINTLYRKRIVIIGSMAHRAVLNGSAVYCASKAGVAMLSRCLAWELAPKGYDVFCIHPSNTEGTPMTKDTIEGLMRYRFLTRDEAENYWNDSPIRQHMLQTDDISALVMFLLGEHGAYLAGAQLELAGGQR